jgi:hypothetical protein
VCFLSLFSKTCCRGCTIAAVRCSFGDTVYSTLLMGWDGCAAVVMPDADKEAALSQIVGAAFGAAGQRCMALSVAIFVGDARKWVRFLHSRRSFGFSASSSSLLHLICSLLQLLPTTTTPPHSPHPVPLPLTPPHHLQLLEHSRPTPQPLPHILP